MTTVPGSRAADRPPLGRRAFIAITVIGLSAFAWGGVARDATKDVLPHSLLPWVLLEGGTDGDALPADVPVARPPGAPLTR